MNPSPQTSRSHRLLIGAGLGIALLVAILLSPFASQQPDGLDRVAQDLEFEHKASPDAAAQKLPFYRIFDEYALRGVPESVATPLAGLVGTLVVFGLAWGIGKLVMRPTPPSQGESGIESGIESGPVESAGPVESGPVAAETPVSPDMEPNE